MSLSSSAAAAAPPPRICFNAHCKERIAESSAPAPPTPRARKGWRLRSGELADLCDRCSAAFEQGSFCDTFHADADGWRKCESCGKRIHCGCVASLSAFMLLDAGGVECIACTPKNVVKVPNHVWQPSSLYTPGPDRFKDLSAKTWTQLTSSSPIPGQWRQASNMWNTSVQSELQQRLSYEFDRPTGNERLMPGPRPIPSQNKKKAEDPPDRLTPRVNCAQLDRLNTGNSSLASSSTFSELRREEGRAIGSQDSNHLVDEVDPTISREVVVSDATLRTSAGISFRPHLNSVVGTSNSSLVKDDSSARQNLASPLLQLNDTKDSAGVTSGQSRRQAHSSHLLKQNFSNPHNVSEINGELQSQMRSGRVRPEGRGRNQLLPRYWPRITDQELQQISGDSNSVITPLFEKILSASDAGRIGRLVLPKKCAEAYFPTISQPEGLPLKVQDIKGQEWVFQFRFWPNNNSRMYVLEGVTPCIQSMKLQAGDIVTFSRMDPEGKLIMGFRKASHISSEQGTQRKGGSGQSSNKEVNNRTDKRNECIPNLHPRALKGNTELPNLGGPSDQAVGSKADKLGFIQKEKTDSKACTLPLKRKSSSLGSKNKRLRIENEDSIELKLTWEEAQELLRPPPNRKPSIILIEGHEIEEYEEAPVLGKPTIFTADQSGGMTQWAQCEDCSKWRKLPANALLPPRWTCSDNLWDPQRSSCNSAQEITTQQLADLLPNNNVSSKKSRGKVENDLVEASDGLDTLANLAIMGEGEPLPTSSQPTTKHPRHRPGCSCIVCIQPPSGKGPKHKQSCQCNVCLTVKRRFQTLTMRKEKLKEAGKAETTRAKKQQETAQVQQLSAQEDGDRPAAPGGDRVGCEAPDDGVAATTSEGFEDENPDDRKPSPCALKTHIDLNMQPDREDQEPLPPVPDAGNLTRLLQDAAA